MKCNLTNNEIKFKELLPFKIPAFFIENKYFNDYNNCSFNEVNNTLYFSFDFVPTIYDITKDKAYSIKNSNFNNTKLSLLHSKKTVISYRFQTIIPIKNQSRIGICYPTEKQKPVVVTFDEKWNELFRNSLLSSKVFRVIYKSKTLYALNKTNIENKIVIYRFTCD